MKMMDPVVIAGNMSSITCMVNGANDLEATFDFTLTSRGNGTVLVNTNDARLHHGFTARASDAGVYICKVVVTSRFLDESISSNTTVTLTVQSKSKEQILVLTLVRCNVGIRKVFEFMFASPSSGSPAYLMVSFTYQFLTKFFICINSML